MSELKIVALCGSLRKNSFNRKVLQAAVNVLPAGMQSSTLDWSLVPPFNADDLERDGIPEVVETLCERIRKADGVLIVTPEYNFALPGMFKNTLDWISRSSAQPFSRKPVALISATTGPLGGARVQNEARRVLLFLNAMVLQKPEIYVGNVAEKFDLNGQCSDEPTLQFLTDQMLAFNQWISEVKRMQG
jgi:chromate reductase